AAAERKVPADRLPVVASGTRPTGPVLRALLGPNPSALAQVQPGRQGVAFPRVWGALPDPAPGRRIATRTRGGPLSSSGPAGGPAGPGHRLDHRSTPGPLRP